MLRMTTRGGRTAPEVKSPLSEEAHVRPGGVCSREPREECGQYDTDGVLPVESPRQDREAVTSQPSWENSVSHHHAVEGLNKGGNEMQDTVLVPEVLCDIRTRGDLPQFSLYDRRNRNPEG